MKKSLLKTVLAVLALAFIFAACKNQSTPESNSGKTSKPDPTPAKSNEIPLTLEALEDNTTITLSRTDLVTNLKYSIGGAEPIEVASSSEPVKIELPRNSCISFYGEGTSNTSSKYFNINCSADCYVYGNVMSLLSSDFKDETEIRQDYAFSRLFGNNTHIKNSTQKELLLPATSLADYCYGGMFNNCTSLEKAPALPAETLADYCYNYMFYVCTSLETAPALPATSLAEGCYYGMFSDCTSLTQAPDLPATKLAEGCYGSMFSGCSSLNYVKCLATDISASYCLDGWLYGVASTGTFEKAASMTGWPSGRSGIPSGWTVKDAD